MQYKLLTFHFQGQRVRCFDGGYNIWWSAIDILTILDLKNPHKVIDRLQRYEITYVNTMEMFGIEPDPKELGEFLIVNEFGLSALIAASRKPQAEPLKEWINLELIPEIREPSLKALASLKPLDNLVLFPTPR